MNTTQNTTTGIATQCAALAPTQKKTNHSTAIAIHELWKRDRAHALSMLSEFYALLTGYSEDELVSLASLEKRFDRQNNTNGGGSPTSVWTSLVVMLVDGEIVEGRLTELYPHAVAMPTYDYPQTVSDALIKADLKEVSNVNNKTNAQGEDTAYDGKTWRQVVSEFRGQAMELAPGSPAPAGFVLVPIKHSQPPMEEGGAYTPLDLYWNSATTGLELNNRSLLDIAAHILGFYIILTGEYIDDDAEIQAFVTADPHFQSEMAQIEALLVY